MHLDYTYEARITQVAAGGRAAGYALAKGDDKESERLDITVKYRNDASDTFSVGAEVDPAATVELPATETPSGEDQR